MSSAHVFSQMKILVVEDQEDIRMMLRDTLLQMGVSKVLTAADGRAALQLMGDPANRVDIVICDWNMPEMSGMELLKELRAQEPSLPFLMITGRADMESVSEARSLGVTSYVVKPISPEKLEAKLRIISQRMAA